MSVRSAASTPVRLLRLILNTIDTLLNYWYKVEVEKYASQVTGSLVALTLCVKCFLRAVCCVCEWYVPCAMS